MSSSKLYYTASPAFYIVGLVIPIASMTVVIFLSIK